MNADKGIAIKTLALTVLVLSSCSLLAPVTDLVQQLEAMTGASIRAEPKRANLVKHQLNISYITYFAVGKVYVAPMDYERWILDMDARWTDACRFRDGYFPTEEFTMTAQWWPELGESQPASWWTPTTDGVVVGWLTDTSSIRAKYERGEQALYLMISGDVGRDYCRLQWLAPRNTPIP